MQIKELIVVFFFAVIVFALVRPICLRFIPGQLFDRRRNVWFLVTAAALLSPSIWLYIAVCLPVLVWATRRDPNPLALYMLLLFAVPPAAIPIPAPGIGALFDMTHARMLAFVVLLPLAVSAFKSDAKPTRATTIATFLLLAYCGLLVILRPHESLTTAIRFTFLLSIDTVLVFYVFSRGVRSEHQITDIALMFVVMFAVLSPLALFESMRSWLLYGEIYINWGHQFFSNLMIDRGGRLRSQLTAGHPLALGYLCAMAFGLWLFVGSTTKSRTIMLLGGAWFWMGLIGAYSRGPWVAAAATLIVYIALTPKPGARLAKAGIGLAILFSLILASPLGPTVIDSLPFIGTLESKNVEYRQNLLETSIELIKNNPLFGDPNVLVRMEHMRQGQGIIDLVNGYVRIALLYGLVTLTAFVGFFLICSISAYRAIRMIRNSREPVPVHLGAALLACMTGSLVFAATAGFEPLMLILSGLLVSFASALQMPPKPVSNPRRNARRVR